MCCQPIKIHVRNFLLTWINMDFKMHYSLFPGHFCILLAFNDTSIRTDSFPITQECSRLTYGNTLNWLTMSNVASIFVVSMFVFSKINIYDWAGPKQLYIAINWYEIYNCLSQILIPINLSHQQGMPDQTPIGPRAFWQMGHIHTNAAMS